MRRDRRVTLTDNDYVLDQGRPLYGGEVQHRLGPQVQEAISQLRSVAPKQGEAVYLRFRTAWTFSEIATAMGCSSRQCAYAHYKRGMTHMKEQLKGLM
jgi:DNA-directed RNA polymerase specialized sigma24 family protein